MIYTLLKSKIHRCRVTAKDLHYEGSITIDKELIEEVNIIPNERVEVYNINNGRRFTTYVIEGRAKSGDIIVNGAAAHLVEKGDLLIVAAFTQMEEQDARVFEPKIIQVDKDNRIIKD